MTSGTALQLAATAALEQAVPRQAEMAASS
jgi:hypothetical protein